MITVEEHAKWEEYLDGLPPYVAETARWYRPWFVYGGPGSDQQCALMSYNEDGTVCVLIVEGHNQGYEVFGVNPLNITRIR